MCVQQAIIIGLPRACARGLDLQAQIQGSMYMGVESPRAYIKERFVREKRPLSL